MDKLPLSGRLAYLGGPIQHSEGPNWRPDVVKTLTERFGINVFDPFADPKQMWVDPLNEAIKNNDYDEIARIAKMFVRKDLCVVDRADFLVSYLPYKIPTTGTHHEIINSNNAKKPTLLVSESKSKVPAWYYGFIPHEFMFGSWDDLYSYLEEVNAGKHKNNNRWHYIYGMV